VRFTVKGWSKRDQPSAAGALAALDRAVPFAFQPTAAEAAAAAMAWQALPPPGFRRAAEPGLSVRFTLKVLPPASRLALNTPCGVSLRAGCAEAEQR
jgi:hypothetical protein